MSTLHVRSNVSLGHHSSMCLGGYASYAADIHTTQDILLAISYASQHHRPIVIIGHGTNIIWRDCGLNGLLLINKILHYEEEPIDDDVVHVRIGAGEVWDTVVSRAVSSGLTGIEALSLIPGTAGATPVQNVGAYGQEISDVLVHLEAYDFSIGQFVTISGEDCRFGYRTSRFKTFDKWRFIITKLTLRLRKGRMVEPFYPSLKLHLENNKVEPTPQNVRDAVIAIRQKKLPDPAVFPNCGSFFANPIIDKVLYEGLKRRYGLVPSWPANTNKIKISAAWLIEQVGYKGFKDDNGMGTWMEQPLVVVNYDAMRTEQPLEFTDRIKEKVKDEFGILLEREPEIIP
ncbi:hypothetical protein TWF694_006118 [Orbilia ellipsospora]|uniref:UDP-N-acetylmuramate dehydrogenase n=1 Tax=Orbilia ellipsospora TaxID=2528407 RepID=A0AAV9WRL6_9PEZI